MSTIEVVVDRPADRQAITDLLSDHYDIVRTADELGESDLYLVDEQTFPAYHEALETRVTDSHPVFCPVVLIRRPSSLVDVSLPDPATQSQPLIVDEVVDAPLTETNIVRRIESLLARRRQSMELQETHRVFLENSPDLFFVLDEEGVVRYQSHSSGEILDYSPEVLHGESMRSYVHPDDRNQWTAFDRLVDDPTGRATFEFRFRIPTGEWRWYELRAVNALDNPAIDGILVVMRDIGERKAREQTLEQFREVVEQTGHAVYITDTEGCIEYLNPAFEAITGYDEDEVLGETPSLLNSSEHDDQYFAELWDTILAGEQWEDEIVDQRKDGEQIVLNQTISPLTSDGNEVEKFVAVAQDITERKEYERRLRSQRDNLEVLNQIVRHDIRNDLQLILSYAEVLEELVADDDREYLQNILASTRSAIDLTKSARDVADVMLQSGSTRKSVTLRYVLEEQISEVRDSYDSVLLTTDTPIPNVDVLADDMLDSVFRNLLTNAIEHNDKNLPEVTVTAKTDDTTVTIRIADNGPGIPDERKQEIFQEGKKGLDSSGTGLGLYLVQTLVSRYGGTVQVADNDPEGVVFEIELPRSTRDSPS